MRPLRSSANFPSDSMTWSSGVISGLVMYLCLWNTVADICVALVPFIHVIHDRQCSNNVLRTNPLLQCSANAILLFGLLCTSISITIGKNGTAL